MYDKYYFEEYARLTLKFVFPYPQENFFCADKPDIQNKINEIGIEVTRTESKTIIEREKYGSRFMGKKPTEKEIKNFGGEFLFHENGTVHGFSPTMGMADPHVFEDISFALKAKKKKFGSYKKFKKMGLYCFNNWFDVNLDINKIAPMDISPFDFLIIMSGDTIHILENGKYKCFILSDNQLSNIKKAAKNCSEDKRGKTKERL